MYVIGKTGTGKSTLLERLMLSDIEAGRGLALVDPHGDLAERIAAQIPAHRKDDLIYLNVPDRSQPFGYNPLKRVMPERRPLAGSGLLEVFEKMWPEAWGVRMEHILRNALLALLDQPQATLPDVLKLLSDKRFRKEALQHIDNRQVRAFWENEYEKYSDRMRADGIAPIQNKVGAFLADPTLYRILTNPERPIHIRRIMDEGKILLVNLAKGQIGEDASSLLGGLLVTTIGLAAFSRRTPNSPRAARSTATSTNSRISQPFQLPICSPSSGSTGSAWSWCTNTSSSSIPRSVMRCSGTLEPSSPSASAPRTRASSGSSSRRNSHRSI
jgi:hypothetical protein